VVDDAILGTANALTVQLLAWIASDPRTYAETMDAWRTSCPRLSVWEDALADGLVQVVRVTNESSVTLTARGIAALHPQTRVA